MTMTNSTLERFREINESTPAFGNLLLADSVLMQVQLSFSVILPWWITSCAGVSALAIYSVAMAVATFVAVPAASPFGERYCKATQISYGIVALIAVGLALALLSTSKNFNLSFVVALGVARVVARAFVDPARSTLLTEMVPSHQLPAAIQLRKTCQAVSGTAGPLVAGIVLSTTGPPAAFGSCAALLAMALFFAARIPRIPNAESSHGGFHQWQRELTQGLSAKWRVPIERGWTLVAFIMWIFQGPAVGMLIPIKVSFLGLSGAWFGLSIGALSLGVLLGSLSGAQFLVARFGRYRVRIVVGLLEGLCIALVGFVDSPNVMVAALVVVGICNACLGLIGATHRALAIPKAYRVRMFAAGSMTNQVAGAVGPALVGVALTLWQVDVVYTACGLLMATSVLGFMFVPRFNEFLSLEHDQIVDWYQHQYPEVFRPKVDSKKTG